MPPTTSRPLRPLLRFGHLVPFAALALYGLLVLALIYGLNLSQQRLAAAGLLTLSAPSACRLRRCEG
jgi:hypothetical protein